MGLEQEPFQRYHEKKSIDSFTVRLNDEERELLERCKAILEQSKDSTALKTLAWIGAKVIHEPKVKYLIELVTNNKRKNKRLGIAEYDT